MRAGRGRAHARRNEASAHGAERRRGPPGRRRRRRHPAIWPEFDARFAAASFESWETAFAAHTFAATEEAVVAR